MGQKKYSKEELRKLKATSRAGAASTHPGSGQAPPPKDASSRSEEEEKQEEAEGSQDAEEKRGRRRRRSGGSPMCSAEKAKLVKQTKMTDFCRPPSKRS